MVQEKSFCTIVKSHYRFKGLEFELVLSIRSFAILFLLMRFFLLAVFSLYVSFLLFWFILNTYGLTPECELE
jgi:hypothetical protein